MNDIISQIISKLNHKEKLELIALLRSAIAEELAAENPIEEPRYCPFCGCPKFTRKGHGRNGEQRYLCHGCARTFSARSLGLLARSKLPASVWMSFAECMADCLSLRETAKRIRVSLYTAWFMRMRVCEIMRYKTPKCRKGIFHADGTMIMGSLKGNFNKTEFFSLPRCAHRNGQDGRKRTRGRSKERIVVECGINELGDCFADICDRGTAGAGELAMLLSTRIPEGSTLVTDKHKSYGATAYRYKHIAIDVKDPSTGNINMVNALHSRLKDFLRSFHGVSTRRLQRYLDWFCYIENFKHGELDKRQMLYIHESESHYFWTRRMTHQQWGNIMVYFSRQYLDKVNGGLT